jgi:coenzyme F420 hydrogenase subunit delta
MEDLPSFLTKEIVVFGCGNTLFGDDGFGPAVAGNLLEDYTIPDHAMVMDVGTSVRDLLFTILLSETRPREVIIVDAIDRGRSPGEVFEISIDEIPEKKTDDFSLHQVPTSNMLKELKELGGLEVTIIVCQVSHIPDEVSPGLSDPAANAVLEASKIIYDKIIMQKDDD